MHLGIPFRNCNAKSGIYAIIHTASGRVYIGSAVNLKGRRKCHLSGLRLGKHRNGYLQRAWRAYGRAAFAWRILETVADPSNLVMVEQKWIDRLKSSERKFGFNLRPIASRNLGHRLSAATKARMRSRGAWTNSRATPKSRRLSSMRAKGNVWAKGKRNAAQFDESQIIDIFKRFAMGDLQADIARLFRTTQSTISRIVRRKVYGGVEIESGIVRMAGSLAGRHASGHRNVNAKLCAASVIAIRFRLDSGESGASVARAYSVNPDTIYAIRKGETWRHIS